MTLGPSSLCQVGDHYNGWRFLLPHETPKVYHCSRQWSCGEHMISNSTIVQRQTLSGNELVSGLITLQKVQTMQE